MLEVQQGLVCRLNRWTFTDHCFSPAELEVLVNALAADRELYEDFFGTVADRKSLLTAGKLMLEGELK